MLHSKTHHWVVLNPKYTSQKFKFEKYKFSVNYDKGKVSRTELV